MSIYQTKTIINQKSVHRKAVERDYKRITTPTYAKVPCNVITLQSVSAFLQAILKLKERWNFVIGQFYTKQNYVNDSSINKGTTKPLMNYHL